MQLPLSNFGSPLMLTSQQVNNIPKELRAIPQWVGAHNKIPLNPRTAVAASVTDPTAWGTFEEAVEGLSRQAYSHVGFVFTDADPYTFIDLDGAKDDNGNALPATDPEWQKRDAQSKSWVQAFESYTETSQSGRGYHIIVKAKLLAAVKIKGLEMYFSKRYAIFTGDAIVPAPIQDRQAKLDEAVSALKLARRIVTENPGAKFEHSTLTDDLVLTKIASASNADAIKELWEGRWQGNYPSQSEADAALLSHLCFYCRDDRQIARLFRQSELGRRTKAQDLRTQYVERSIASIRKYEPQPIDFTNFKTPPPKEPVVRQVHRTYPRPPDVLGDLADFIYNASIHPVREISYGGAIAFAAGVMGRHFNISGTGLNQYVLVLAATGRGKEGAADGIDLIYQTLRTQIPEVESFRGPSNFASGAGLVRMLSDREVPAALAVVGEFGLRLCAMTDPRANGAELGLKAALLDFFSKSGEYKTVSPVAYSDNTKNTKLLDSPSLSILGLSTPETFFNKLTESSVADGLIPRFLTIVYEGDPQVGSKNRNTQMDATLQQKLLKAVETSIYMSRNSSYCHIATTLPAQKLLDEFEHSVVERMKAIGTDGASVALLNRAHLKALRLAGLCACLNYPLAPKVTEFEAKWAVEFVDVDLTHMMARFEKGDVGEGDAKQLNVLRERMRSFFNTARPPTKNTTWLNMLAKGAIPHSLISQSLLSKACFANDRRGASAALTASLKELMAMGEVREIPAQQVLNDFETSSKAYVMVEGT